MSQHDGAAAGLTDTTRTAVVQPLPQPTATWTALIIKRTFATTDTFTFAILIPSGHDEMQQLNTVPKHACRLIDRFTRQKMYFERWIDHNLQSGQAYTFRVVASEDPGAIRLHVTRTDQSPGQTVNDWFDPGFNIGHSPQIEILADDVFEPLLLEMTEFANDSDYSAYFQFEAASSLNECPSFVGIKINGTEELEWRKYGGMYPAPPPDAWHEDWAGAKQGNAFINGDDELEIIVPDVHKNNAHHAYYNAFNSKHKQLLKVLNAVGDVPQSVRGKLNLSPIWKLLRDEMGGQLMCSDLMLPRCRGTNATHVTMITAELNKWLTIHPSNIIHDQYIVDIHDETDDGMNTDAEMDSSDSEMYENTDTGSQSDGGTASDATVEA